MLTKLAAARMEAGYKTKKEFQRTLSNAGLRISTNTYNRIEAGVQIADVGVACFISDFLGRDIREIFLPLLTRKTSRNKDPHPAA